MSYSITSPIEGYTGRSNIGPHALQFEGGVAEVGTLEDSVRDYLERRGYTVTPEADETEEESSAAEEFDPADHTAADVIDHVNSLYTSPDEIDRIVALETEGKARKGLLSDLAARREEIASAAEGQQTHDTPEG